MDLNFLALPLSIGVGLGTLTLLVVAHEFGHFAAARKLGVGVKEFAVGFPPRLAARKLAGTEFRLNWLPIGGYVRLQGEDGRDSGPGSFSGEPVSTRLAILSAGPAMNFLVGFLLFWVSAMIYAPIGTQITAVVAGSPADSAGLRPGDVIVGLNDRIDILPEDVYALTTSSAGRLIELEIERSGSRLRAELTPRVDPPSGEGPLGLRINYRFGGQSPPDALGLAVQYSVEAATLLPRFTAGALTGQGELNVTGVIGIVESFGQAANFGLGVVLGLAASISIQVALFNLLPWPVLDGGRMVLIGIESLRGRRISQDTERALQIVSMAILVILVVAVTASDISRITGVAP